MEMLSIAGVMLETGLTVIPLALLDECLLCVVHWTILLYKFKVEVLYDGIIAPGFECRISQARHNNTLQ